MTRFGVALIAAVMGLALGTAQAAPAAGNATVKALVAAASKYVVKYQQEFAYLLADESYTQTTINAGGQAQNRVLRSELFLTYLPADNEWVAVRDVLNVDGAPTAGREDLRTLLAKRSDVRGVISEVVARNAQYNIGQVIRNFNEPTLPLLLLGAKRVNEVQFERKELTLDGAVMLATLGFTERGRPTLVRGPKGSMPGKGEIVIEADTGVVRRTTFELSHDGFKVKLSTEYAKDKVLGLWLPAVLTERYEIDTDVHEVVVGQATYSNYRRFDVTTRIR